MNNLVLRSITGIVFIASIIFPLLYSEVISTLVFALYFVLGIIEFYKLFKTSAEVSIRWELSSFFAIFIYGLLIFTIADYIPSVSIIFVPILMLGLLLTELWRKKANPIFNTAVNFLGIIYVVVPFVFLQLILKIDKTDFPMLLGMFILIWTNDSFAYLSGRLLGKHKMIERISPKKTWEGTIGGILFTMIAGFIIAYLTNGSMEFWLISAAIIAPSAILGDLIESMFKRNLNLKDSGNLLPGHGGILDRFDATLFVVAFFYVWIIIYSFVL